MRSLLLGLLLAGCLRPDALDLPSPMSAPSPATFTPVDANGDGLYDHLAVEAEILIADPGAYRVSARLAKAGRTVAVRQGWSSSLAFQSVEVTAAAPGRVGASFQFSGEDIYQSGLDGPYDLELRVGPAANSFQIVDSLDIETAAYDHRAFGELPRSGAPTPD